MKRFKILKISTILLIFNVVLNSSLSFAQGESPNPLCGNASLDITAGEECDLGHAINEAGQFGCNAQCKKIDGWECTKTQEEYDAKVNQAKELYGLLNTDSTIAITNKCSTTPALSNQAWCKKFYENLDSFIVLNNLIAVDCSAVGTLQTLALKTGVAYSVNCQGSPQQAVATTPTPEQLKQACLAKYTTVTNGTQANFPIQINRNGVSFGSIAKVNNNYIGCNLTSVNNCQMKCAARMGATCYLKDINDTIPDSALRNANNQFIWTITSTSACATSYEQGAFDVGTKYTP